MPRDYLPTGPGFCDWLENLKLEFAAVAASLGFSGPEITAVLADLSWAIFVCRSSSNAQTFGSSWVQFRDTLLDGNPGQPVGSPPGTTMPALPTAPAPAAGVISRIRILVKRIKASPNYTPTIGQTLRILPNSAPVDETTAKPNTKALALPMFKAKLKWTGNGFPAIHTRTRRDGETEWTDLGLAVGNTLVDERPPAEAGKPEVRTYEQIYARDNQPVGQWSDAVRVTLQP